MAIPHAGFHRPVVARVTSSLGVRFKRDALYGLTKYVNSRICATMNFDPAVMKVSADEACTLLKGLANPHRLMIVCALIDGEQSVGALAETLGVRETLASQHLGLLRRDGIVHARRDGQTIYYALRGGQARALVETLSSLFCPTA